MNFASVLKKRVSIRKYKPGVSVSDSDINTIINSINQAPSAKNLQSYKLYIAKSVETKNALSACFFNQRSDFIKNAALILVFCSNEENNREYFGDRAKMYALQDATIAATYAILTATDLGYASCWVGNFHDEEIKKVLKTALTPVASIIVGQADEIVSHQPRKLVDQLVETV